MLVRANVFHALGGFDGDYFAHMEEIDGVACTTAWVGYYVDNLLSRSIMSGGYLAYSSNRKIFLNFRNNRATLFKNDSSDFHLIYKLPLRFILDGLAGISFYSTERKRMFRRSSRAYGQFLLWIPD
jgi:GT2 family glycosyltransferase